MGLRNRMKATPASAESLARNNSIGRIGVYRAFTYPEWLRASGEAQRRAEQEQREAEFEMKREGGIRRQQALAEAA